MIHIDFSFRGFGFGLWLNTIKCESTAVRFVTIAVGPFTFHVSRKP